MYYARIANNGSGFTNQLFSLITSIIIADENKKKVLVVGNFLNDFSKNNYSPISNILNLDKINIFLKKNYDIIIVDEMKTILSIKNVLYGTKENNKDLTNYVVNNCYKNNALIIKKETDFNNINGDPCYGIEKKIFLTYTLNNHLIKEIYTVPLNNDIVIDFKDSTYKHEFAWINTYDMNMFEKILVNIFYHDEFLEKGCSILNKIDINKKVNVFHLRLEDDALDHWSKMNNLSRNDFKNCIEKKYIDLIKKYISKNDENIIISSSLDNNVIEFLKNNNYNFKYNEKFFDGREKNAIVDLLTSRYCNNIFIGNFNVENLNGSTFSYYIGKIINYETKKIFIDLDNIQNNEKIYN